jgi:hypothetical protein
VQRHCDGMHAWQKTSALETRQHDYIEQCKTTPQQRACCGAWKRRVTATSQATHANGRFSGANEEAPSRNAMATLKPHMEKRRSDGTGWSTDNKGRSGPWMRTLS